MCAQNKTKKGNKAFSYLFWTHLSITIPAIVSGRLGAMSRMEVFLYQAWIACQWIALLRCSTMSQRRKNTERDKKPHYYYSSLTLCVNNLRGLHYYEHWLMHNWYQLQWLSSRQTVRLHCTVESARFTMKQHFLLDSLLQ